MSIDTILDRGEKDNPGQFSDIRAFWDRIREQLGLKKWRKRDAPEKFFCPHEDYGEVYVVLPEEWTGKHLEARDEMIAAIQSTPWKDNPDLVQLAVSLRIADEFRIPQLGDDPEKWDFSKVPITVISWVTDMVLGDFIAATYVPKVK